MGRSPPGVQREGVRRSDRWSILALSSSPRGARWEKVRTRAEKRAALSVFWGLCVDAKRQHTFGRILFFSPAGATGLASSDQGPWARRFFFFCKLFRGRSL